MSNKKIVHYSNKNITIDVEITKEYIELKKKINKLTEQLKPIEDTLKQELRDVMRKIDVNKFSSNGLSVSLKKDYTKKYFDTESFKENEKELFDKYQSYTDVKGSLSISIDKEV